MWKQYSQHKAVRRQLDRIKPENRELFQQRHSQELILYEAAARYLKELKDSGEEITPKAWAREAASLTAAKDLKYMDMKAMREELKARCGPASAPAHRPQSGRQAASPGGCDIPDGLSNRRTDRGRGFSPAAVHPLPAALRFVPAIGFSSPA